MSARFTRTKEDFVCFQCGTAVSGTGYTNHCSNCLWSLHVDVFPGDRANPCGGPMRPIAVEGTQPPYRVVHRCETCKEIRRNKTSPEDDFDTLLELVRSGSFS